MLLRLVVCNFLSFGEEVEFNMFPYNKLRNKREHIYQSTGVEVLKTAVLYGANGSGKSNFVKAMDFLHNLLTEGSIYQAELPTFFYKLTAEAQQQPTSLQLEFIKDDKVLEYGISFSRRKGIEREYLCLNAEAGVEKEEVLFDRKRSAEGHTELRLTERYLQSERDRLVVDIYAKEVLKKGRPFLHLAKDKTSYPDIQQAYQWFKEQLYIIHPEAKYADLAVMLSRNESFLRFTNHIITRLDTGIAEVRCEEMDADAFFGEDDQALKDEIAMYLDKEEQERMVRFDGGAAVVYRDEKGDLMVNKITTQHRGKGNANYSFEFKEESDGTLRIFDLLPAIDLLFRAPAVFFIDEIGRSLHPSLLRELLKLFLEHTATQGQLIFTTHESQLLDLNLFRTDEIWFIEKNEEGASVMYPLSEFQPRYDSDVQKGYLNGRFGAIPFLGDLKNLNWGNYEAV